MTRMIKIIINKTQKKYFHYQVYQKNFTLVAQKLENINFILQIDTALTTKMMIGIKKFILH